MEYDREDLEKQEVFEDFNDVKFIDKNYGSPHYASLVGDKDFELLSEIWEELDNRLNKLEIDKPFKDLTKDEKIRITKYLALEIISWRDLGIDFI